MTRTGGQPRAVVDSYQVPEPLKQYEFWVVWAPDLGKTARAPWQEGHMYAAEWAADGPHDPRTSYDRAASVASLLVEQIHATWPFPPDGPLPSTVKPAVLLPVASDHPGLLFIDLDDVRDPDTGAITPEAWTIVERLGGYCEVSHSGTGLHVWVRAYLPEGFGKFIESLDGVGQLELYDHGRMTAGTWRHVAGTPRDAVPEAQGVVDSLVAEYETETCDGCGTRTRAAALPDDDPECPACGAPMWRDTGGGQGARHGTRDTTTNADAASVGPVPGEENAYYDLDLHAVADTGPFSHYGDRQQGPHPAHGGTSHPDRESTNFRIDGDVWTCYAHDTGGEALALLAILEDVVACRNVARVYTDRETLLRACLAARARVSALNGEVPPYEALVAVAERADLPMADPEDGVLGKTSYTVARRLFDDLAPADI